MEKFFNRLLIITFTAAMLVFFFATVAKKQPEVLFFDNRKAATLEDGDLEKWYSDRLAFRDSLLKGYVLVNKNIFQKKEVNNVVYGENALLAYYTTNSFDEEQTNSDITAMADYLQRVKETSEKSGGKLVYVGIPAELSVFKEAYPKGFCDYSPRFDYLQENFFAALDEKGIDYIDTKPYFVNSTQKEKEYFTNDHHYTFFGALQVYNMLAERLNLHPLKEEDFDYETLPNAFLGAMSRKIYDLYPNDNRVTLGYLKNAPKFTRYDMDQPVDANLYTLPSPTDYATYNIFMGGDKAETCIDTDRAVLPTVLVVGDSYSNALESILWSSVGKMYSLDYRYYKGKNLLNYIEEKKPDYVIMIRDETVYVDQSGNGFCEPQ